MPQRAATIESLPAAFAMVKAMQAQGLDWGEGYRPLVRQALAEIIETEMSAAVDRRLESLEAEDDADRRNGYYRRSLLTELGDIELLVARTRRYCPTEVARAYARRFAERWGQAYPAAVTCLRDDLDELLTCFRYKTPAERRAVRTTNAIERRFPEVRRRTRPMGVFQDTTSIDRILFAVFTHENKIQGIPTLLSPTHNL